MSEPSLKLKTARSVKWNAIDRVSSQILYAITGIVLANKLTPEDFGLVGAILVFQAFASLLVDSGFSFALIQRKSPTRLDYSTVLWFNMAISVVIYAVLFVGAPLIALCFEGDQRLIPLSRVMFLTFILNASSIVQVNRFTKQMDVRPVAIANFVSLAAGGIGGIWLAVKGYGAWAIVWQSIILAAVKSALLWIMSRWTPLLRFSLQSLRSFFAVGSGMMLTSFLNTVFNTIYSFIIGNRCGLVPLGYYTQSDKWSKMGITSLSQTLTSAFLPPLSAVQDDTERFRRLCSKMNRMTAYILFPVMTGLMIMAEPIFHVLFGSKWDLSIPLFQLLLLRGIFTVIAGLHNNYILALGRSRLIVGLEVLRDGAAMLALGITIPYLNLSSAADLLLGVRILLYGQIIASVISAIATTAVITRITSASWLSYLRDLAPYAALTALISPLLVWIGSLAAPAWLILAAQCLAGAGAYLCANHLLHSHIQAEAIAYFRGKL